MGRPPLGNRATTFRFSGEIFDRIDAVLGIGVDRKQGRAQFVREAVEAQLEQREAGLPPERRISPAALALARLYDSVTPSTRALIDDTVRVLARRK